MRKNRDRCHGPHMASQARLDIQEGDLGSDGKVYEGALSSLRTWQPRRKPATAVVHWQQRLRCQWRERDLHSRGSEAQD